MDGDGERENGAEQAERDQDHAEGVKRALEGFMRERAPELRRTGDPKARYRRPWWAKKRVGR